MFKIKKISQLKTLLATLFLSSLCFTNVALGGGIAIPAGTGLPDPADTTGQGPVVQVTVQIMEWVLGVFMIVAIIAFVYTGILFLTSGGNQYQADAAKKSFTYSVIGVIAVGSALVLLNTIDTILR